MRSFTFFFLIVFSSVTCHSQENKIIRYFDFWEKPTDSKSPYFRAEFIKQDSIYQCSSYWVKSGKLRCKSQYRDTLLQKPLGLLVRYFENGLIEDSIFYENNSRTKEIFHYYQNGKLWVHCRQQGKSEVCKGFDENGNLIDDFIYSKEAEFPGGNEGWLTYLSNGLGKFNPGKRGAPVGTYTVVVMFIVGKDGSLMEIKAETKFGYGMEDKAIEIIKRSPRWDPAIMRNKKVNAYRRQPLTFVVAAE